MQVAIIGSHSFIAQSIVDLWADKYELILIDLAEYHYPSKSFTSGFNWQLILNCDAIIHCAAAGVQSDHSFSPEEIIQINFHEPIRLIRKLEEKGYVGRLITFGSYFSAGISQTKKPLSEHDLVNAENQQPSIYCSSKADLTKFIFENASTINHVHLVLTNVFGPREAKERLFPYILNCIKNGDHMQFSSGHQIRQFTFVYDIVRALESFLTKNKHGVFNFSNPKTMTVKEVIEEAISFGKERFRTIPDYSFGTMSRSDTDMSFLALDTSSFISAFGDFSFTPLQKALESYLENE